MTSGLPLVLTLGEPAGIGPDLTLQVWRQRSELNLPPFYVIGDPDFYRQRSSALGLDVPVAAIMAPQAVTTFARALPVAPLDLKISAEPGHPDATSAPFAPARLSVTVRPATMRRNSSGSAGAGRLRSMGSGPAAFAGPMWA